MIETDEALRLRLPDECTRRYPIPVLWSPREIDLQQPRLLFEKVYECGVLRLVGENPDDSGSRSKALFQSIGKSTRKSRVRIARDNDQLAAALTLHLILNEGCKFIIVREPLTHDGGIPIRF